MELDLLLKGFAVVFQPSCFGLIFLGTLSGVLIGALPGLTATMGVALLIPFTFGLPVHQGVGMLLGIFCGAIYGGSISAILIRTPGTPAAAATVLDGYPLNQKGEAGRALSMSIFASFVGGFSGALIMTFASPQISRIALQFSAPEYFGLAIFGLSIIISISGNSIVKGIIAGFFGMLISTIGLDPMAGYPRFTFGCMDLFEGPAFIPTLIGLFALSEVFKGVEVLYKQEAVKVVKRQFMPSLADLKKVWLTIAKSTFIGTFIGSIPGAGSDISAFVAYGEAKRSSKHPETFGKGEITGVAAAEAANNACTGGAMIPMLSLGVPGDAVTAVLLGALVIQGLQPGPLLFKDHIDIVYNIFAGMMTANVLMFLIGIFGIRYFVKIISVERSFLIPIIFLLSIVGSYSMRNSLFDVGLAVVFGIIGYFMQRYDFPASPILLSLILGPLAESSMRRALIVSQGDFSIFFTRPISLTLIILAIASLIAATVMQLKLEKKMLAENAEKTQSGS